MVFPAEERICLRLLEKGISSMKGIRIFQTKIKELFKWLKKEKRVEWQEKNPSMWK